VRYVIEGSVRKAGSRVRITGQLIDAISGAHLWADHFDGPLDNVFDLQDEITMSVVGAIAPKLQQAEIERTKRKPTGSLDAYDYYLRGIACTRRFTKDATDEALRFFAKAIELDPEFGAAYGRAARCQVWRHTNGWLSDEGKREAVLQARRAVHFGSQDASALAGAGLALSIIADEPDAAAALMDRALAMNPNLADAWHFSCWVRLQLGLPELGLSHELRAMRLSPLDPLLVNMQTAAALAEFALGRFAEAASWAQLATSHGPVWVTPWGIAAASSALAGRMAEAKCAVAHLRQLVPSLTLTDLTRFGPARRRADVLAKYVEGLRKAGVPD
jgi:tetratricopeptide (TPR) repeat protein